MHVPLSQSVPAGKKNKSPRKIDLTRRSHSTRVHTCTRTCTRHRRMGIALLILLHQHGDADCFLGTFRDVLTVFFFFLNMQDPLQMRK